MTKTKQQFIIRWEQHLNEQIIDLDTILTLTGKTVVEITDIFFDYCEANDAYQGKYVKDDVVIAEYYSQDEK